MIKMKPNNFTQNTKLICDWTDKKNYLILYRMLKLYARHGLVVDKAYEIISFKQKKWLEVFINFKTQKKNRATNDFEKDF